MLGVFSIITSLSYHPPQRPSGGKAIVCLSDELHKVDPVFQSAVLLCFSGRPTGSPHHRDLFDLALPVRILRLAWTVDRYGTQMQLIANLAGFVHEDSLEV